MVQTMGRRMLDFDQILPEKEIHPRFHFNTSIKF